MIFNIKIQKGPNKMKYVQTCTCLHGSFFLYYFINEDRLEKQYLFFTLEWICSLPPVNAIRTVSIATNGDAQEKCCQSFR